jgi:hypothetical protein
MAENILNKQFKEKDIARLRNLITKKYGDKTGIQVGYSKVTQHHEEGDVWEENGKKWTITNGIKQNITKLDKAKKAHLTPLFCPSCNNLMKKRFDKDYYNIHKKCFDCVIDFETELKRIGAWEEYHKNIHNSDIEHFIVDFKNWVEEQVNDSNSSFITEQGDVENWVGGSNKKVIENLEETINYLNSLKK